MGNGVSMRSQWQELEQVRRVQQTLWYVLTAIGVVEMIFGAWAVGLLFR